MICHKCNIQWRAVYRKAGKLIFIHELNVHSVSRYTDDKGTDIICKSDQRAILYVYGSASSSFAPI